MARGAEPAQRVRRSGEGLVAAVHGAVQIDDDSEHGAALSAAARPVGSGAGVNRAGGGRSGRRRTGQYSESLLKR
ncbi:hypothetical protein GCM10027440_41010 [Nocardiopsis coralliicola]